MSKRTRTFELPPHDTDAEAALLGAILLSVEAAAQVVDVLAPGDFYKPAHGVIYDAVGALHRAGEPVDAVTVADRLRLAGMLDAIGGPATLVTLQASTPSTTGVLKYARIITAAADRRALLALAEDLRQLAYVPDPDLARARARLAFDRWAGGRAVEVVDVEAPGEPGWQTLDDVAAFLARYVVFPSDGARDAVALWVAHTFVFSAFEVSPRLALLSAEKRSGKTRTLKLVQLLTRDPRRVSNVTTSYLFRLIEKVRPTVLVDEVDAIFGPKASANHEDLRALINDGWEHGATVGRIVGEGARMEPHDFPAFAPMALAGIGDLPDTIVDRAVVVRMKRRTPAERVTSFRRRRVVPEAAALHERLARWSASLRDLGDVEPALPAGVDDRAADLWEPLIVLADAAGGTWPDRARLACAGFEAVRVEDDDSWRVNLLAEIVAAFDEDGRDRLSAKELGARLVERNAVTDEPSARRLAGWLRPFDVRAQRGRFNGEPWRGYYRHDLDDAQRRYLTPLEEAARSDATRRDAPEDENGRVTTRHYAPLSTGASPGSFEAAITGDSRPSPAAAAGRLDLDLDAPGDLVDLPLDEVEICRACGLACVTRDRVGPVHPLCREKERAQ